MRAIWYDRQGPADQVLRFGDLPDPEPGPGEVLVRVRLSGVRQYFAAQMMRRILVDAARKRGSRRQGGIPEKVDLDNSPVLSPAPDRSILALDEALTAFSRMAPRQAKVVELNYFGGLTEEEIVAALKVSPRTVRRDWHFAKAWLLPELRLQ